MTDGIGGKDPGYYGPGVIGPERYKEEQALIEKGANIFGPGVTGLGLPNQAVNVAGPGVTGQTDVAPTAAVPEVVSLSIKELEEALEANVALVDKFLTAELARPGGVRKGALDALEVAESLRPDGAREDVLAQIAAARAGE
jgi:hypothetical protein